MTLASNLRGLGDAELDQKLHEAYQELLNLRFQQATKQLDNTSRLRVVRREIARLKTIKREREVA